MLINMKWNYFSSKNSIDLRAELKTILHGSSDFTEIGQWVILRRYDLTKYSKFYNSITDEGIGGSKYEYRDELLKTYKWNSWTADPFSEQQAPLGVLTIPLVTFFFEHTVNPRETDEIFEFEWADHTLTPTLSGVYKTRPYLVKYDIKNVQTYRLDQGRIEFYACRSLKENVR